MFPSPPGVLFAGDESIMPSQLLQQPPSPSFISHIQPIIIPPTLEGNTSSQLSNYLLSTIEQPHATRNGAYVFQDEVSLDLAVDWNALKDLLVETVNGGTGFNGFLAVAGYNLQTGIPISGYPIHIQNLSSILTPSQINAILLQQLGLSSNATVFTFPFNTSISSAVARVDGLVGNNTLGHQIVTLVNNTLNNAMNSTFNGVRIQNQQITINITSALTNFINRLNITSIDASAESVSVPGDGTLDFHNVHLVINGNAPINLPLVVIPLNNVLAYLPQDPAAKDYPLAVPNTYTIVHNSSSPHGFAALRGELLLAAFSQCVPSSPSSSFEYRPQNHPLPLTTKQTINLRIIIAVLTSIFILIPLCISSPSLINILVYSFPLNLNLIICLIGYIPSAFIVFVVKERFSKATHLQYVSSVSPYLYWISVYIWDMFQFSILTLLTLSFFFIYGKNASQVFVSSAESTLAVFLLLWLYGASIIPLSYLYSMGFDNFSSAQISILTINFITGFIFVLAYFVMSSIPETAAEAAILVNIFRFFPGYLIGNKFNSPLVN